MLNNERANIYEQEKVHCYGGRAAITVEATVLKNDGETVNIDVAPKNGNRDTEWGRKITLQLSADELPILASVCLGYLPKCHFKRSDKGIEVERQKDKLFIRATAGQGNCFSLPVPIGHAFKVTSLVLRQLEKQSSLSNSLLVSAIRGCAALYRLEA